MEDTLSVLPSLHISSLMFLRFNIDYFVKFFCPKSFCKKSGLFLQVCPSMLVSFVLFPHLSKPGMCKPKREEMKIGKKKKAVEHSLRDLYFRRTSDAGSQYRYGRVGRSIKPPSTPIVIPNSQTYTKSVKNACFPIFNSITMDRRTDGPTDGQSLL